MKIYEYDPDEPCCQLCGDDADAEMGEFFDPAEPDVHIVAHATCGLDHGLQLS